MVGYSENGERIKGRTKGNGKSMSDSAAATALLLLPPYTAGDGVR